MKIKYAAKTKIALTAKEWELYDLEGAPEVAKQLSHELSMAINEAWEMIYFGKTYEVGSKHIEDKFSTVANKYSNFGTTDSEAKHVYSFLVEKLFDPYFVKFVVKKHPEYKSEKKLLNV